ncbi:diacylglycerol/lipid kinase family protein [Pareuzebyella sediminis]|uniref:diacylglycerol/lipid kinase family protein n=1 Tax=Pareuzebyella sediminis TaxID=2607998 RepID=UPI0011EC020B|nr:diacylglycerol kinase family protein [Pareuzebyella sediminis]
MKIVHFIVNPIAGGGKNWITEHYLNKFFETDKFKTVVKYSNYKGHAKLLTEESVVEKAQIIVACGGDGTINEVASILVNSEIVLGIIPIGSGNGLAASLNIPKDIVESIALIKRNNTSLIDIGRANESYFFSNMGIGFDAEVINCYQLGGRHRLIGYIKSIVTTFFEFKSLENISVELAGKSRNISPFLFFISNSSILGYNVSLTKKASLKDGLLDVVLIENTNKLKILWISFLVLLRQSKRIKGLHHEQVRSLKLVSENGSYKWLTQQDGESLVVDKKEIEIEVLPNALKVLV